MREGQKVRRNKNLASGPLDKAEEDLFLTWQEIAPESENRNRRNGERNRRGWGGVDTINAATVVDLASLGIVNSLDV